MNYKIIPITFKHACSLVAIYHRHHKPPQGHKFSIGVEVNGELCAIAIVGRPVSRMLDDGLTLEITRICTINDEVKNTISILLGSICRAGKALGYTRVITYILEEELGSSLKASNFSEDGKTDGGSWSRPSRFREDDHPLDRKIRYIRMLE